MSKVYVVHEVKRYHCPVCGSSKITRRSGMSECHRGHRFEEGVLQSVHDLTPASIYGQVEVLYAGRNPGLALQPIVQSMRRQLRDFSDDDYLLPLGDPVLIGIAASIAAEMNRGVVSFLRWDRQTRQYVEIKTNTKAVTSAAA